MVVGDIKKGKKGRGRRKEGKAGMLISRRPWSRVGWAIKIWEKGGGKGGKKEGREKKGTGSGNPPMGRHYILRSFLGLNLLIRRKGGGGKGKRERKKKEGGEKKVA